jgi:hypothetical protein
LIEIMKAYNAVMVRMFALIFVISLPRHRIFIWVGSIGTCLQVAI